MAEATHSTNSTYGGFAIRVKLFLVDSPAVRTMKSRPCNFGAVLWGLLETETALARGEADLRTLAEAEHAPARGKRVRQASEVVLRGRAET